MDSKILYLDIEWKPATAYVWKMWDENISPEQLIDDGGLLCFCAHWEGEKEYLFYSEWENGNAAMAAVLFKLLSEADAVVTYNGEKYDLPKIRGHLILNGMTPPPPPTSIDLLKTVRKMGFVMNRLAYVGPLLGVGSKKKHEGFGLWRSVMEGDSSAQYRMQRYCTQDVRLLVHLYKKVLPFIDNHPHLGDNKGACGGCGSSHVQLRGFRRTKYFKVQRLQCQDCGAWSTGQRHKVK